jgi:biotin carboxyl carrier protein
MKRYKIRIDGTLFDVAVLDDPRGDQVRVQVDGEILIVDVQAIEPTAPPPEIPIPAVAPPTTPEVTGNHTVTSPLPGVVKTIYVREGQSVVADDPLVVIEAMKMENIIRATHSGTVGTVHVVEGRQVAYGEPLLDVDR